MPDKSGTGDGFRFAGGPSGRKFGSASRLAGGSGAKGKTAAAGARDKVIAEGRQEYAENCVGCHSDDAKGGGELAARLVKPPKDLTIIGAANGGSFPFWRIFAIVSGETPVAGHDTHQMPDYFARLKRNDFKPGYLPAHVRLLELTHYLESIQTK